MDITNAKLAITNATKTQYVTSGNNGMLLVDSDSKDLVTKINDVIYTYPTSGSVSNMITNILPNQDLNTSADVYFNTITSPTISAIQAQLGYLTNPLVKDPTETQEISGAGLKFVNAVRLISTSAYDLYETGKQEWKNTSATIFSSAANIIDTNSSIRAAGNISANKFIDYGFAGSKVLVTNGSEIVESTNITTNELEFINNLSANAQTQLTNLSATKTDKTITITAGAQLTGGGSLSTNRTISLATTGTAGTYDKVVTNAYGQVTSGRLMISADVPQLPATKIGSGNIDNTEFEYLNGVSANIQTQINNVYTDSSMVVIKNPAFSQTISGQALYIVRDSASNDAFGVRTTADEVNRFLITHDGKHLWGDGTNVRDTNLYRNGVNGLKTDDVFESVYGLRSTNYNSIMLNNLGGAGVEVNYVTAGPFGRVVTYDRDTASYLPTRIEGSQLQFCVSGTVEAIIDDVGMYMPAHTASRVLVTNGSKYFTTSNITSAELNYLTGTSANIQTQLANLSATSLPLRLPQASYWLPTSGITISAEFSTFKNVEEWELDFSRLGVDAGTTISASIYHSGSLYDTKSVTITANTDTTMRFLFRVIRSPWNINVSYVGIMPDGSTYVKSIPNLTTPSTGLAIKLLASGTNTVRCETVYINRRKIS